MSQLFANDTALVAHLKEKLQRLGTGFRKVCEKKKFRVNMNKS